MPMDAENVRSSGWTGSGWRPVEVTRRTHFGSGQLQDISFRPASGLFHMSSLDGYTPVLRSWGFGMRRREFITLFGGAAVSWPLAGRAQQSLKPVIGFLSSASPVGWDRYLAAFRDGLRNQG